jgi:predicted nuclease of predicted toxin-antitoxin system
VKVLLDESVPVQIRRALSGHEVRTVQEAGWESLTNGALLQRAEQEFDVFLTADKNLKYQQNLRGRQIAIIELSTNKRRVVESRFDLIRDTVARVKAGDFIELAL